MLKTEMRNPASMHLDRMDTLSMLRLINRENARAVEAVEEALPAIARAVDAVTAAFRAGGRLFYIGAGPPAGWRWRMRRNALPPSAFPPTWWWGSWRAASGV